jgi:prolyl oligopeptidase
MFKTSLIVAVGNAGLGLLPLMIVALAASCGPGEEKGPRVDVPKPPPTEREPVEETMHGETITDPYRWLEDQQSPRTRAWIESQNEYTDSILGQIDSRLALEELASSLHVKEDRSVPKLRGGKLFFSKRDPGRDLAVIYVQEPGQDPRPLIDPHSWTEDHSKSAEIMAVSEDGRLLAYGVRQGGQDELVVKVHDVESGVDLTDELPKARYFLFQFRPDGDGFYYTRYDERGSRVHYHELGTDPSADPELFGEGYDPGKIIWSQLSPDGRYLLATVSYGSSGARTEVFIDDLSNAAGFQPVVEGIEARFEGAFAGDRLILRTNWEAPNGRLLSVPLSDPRLAEAEEIVAERDDTVIESVKPAAGRLLVTSLRNVVSEVSLYRPDGTREGELDLEGKVTLGQIDADWDRQEVLYSVSSFHRPATVYRHDLEAGTRTEWWREPAPIDPADYTVEQVRYASKDGTEVPMFVVHRKGLEKNGQAATLLTGYGGFGVSRTPRFSEAGAAWLELGGVLAVANLRGGGELGETWHRAGMLENKQNTFDDFIAAAEWLIERGYTRPEKLGIIGGSNGGLLVGAAMVQRPSLFGAVVCRYPLLDMLRYHEFLVARFWVPEYGSAEDSEQFEVLRAYSPYHNVEEGMEYPAVLFITGDGDTRVAPLHARKMTALVQHATGSEEPVMLRYHTKAGHAGSKPVSQEIEDTADLLAFLTWQLDVPVDR